LTRIVASSGALVLSGACGGVAPPVVAPSPGRAHVSPSARIAPWLQQPDRLVQQSIFLRVFPGAVLAVGTSKGLVHLRTFGRLTYDPSSEPVATDTIFDLASVTKVVATTAVAAALVSGNRLSLDTPVSRFHPCFVEGGKERVVVRQLLTHSAGLSAWTSLYRDVSGRTAAFDRICALDLEYEPGTRSLYSDLSMDLLAAIIEQATHEGLDTAAETLVFRPLGMNAMGGVTGHAGLFGTAPDLARFAQMMLNRGSLDGKRIVSAETIDLFTRRCDVPGSGRALGWNMVDEWAGSFWSERAYGHTGVTGTMIWIDPEYDAFMVLLTNSVYPKYSGDAFRRLRRDVGDAVISAVRMQRQTPKPGS
jgi:beta-N-acetylhexosaminidase